MGVVSLTERDLSGQRPPGTQIPPDREPSSGQRHSPGQRPPWTETLPGQRSPVDRQTPVKTLPSQTSFADGN